MQTAKGKRDLRMPGSDTPAPHVVLFNNLSLHALICAKCIVAQSYAGPILRNDKLNAGPSSLYSFSFIPFPSFLN